MYTYKKQLGSIDWRVYIGIVLTLAVALGVWNWWQGRDRLERLGPTVPALVAPAASAVIDADDDLTQLVWRHNEIDSTYRANMEFIVCVLDEDETCETPSALTTPSFRRWTATTPNLSVSSVGTSTINHEFTFLIPGAQQVTYGDEGRRLRWAVIACWPNVADKCAATTPAEFTMEAPNVRAGNPDSLSSPPNTSGISTVTYSVRARNTNMKDSGPFDFSFWHALVFVDASGTPILDLSHPSLPPNPMFVTKDGKDIPATASVDTDTVFGVMLPDAANLARQFNIGNIPSTLTTAPAAIDSRTFDVAPPVGIAIFLEIDPSDTRIESDETDDFRGKLEVAL
ncbi:MAG: hypothetical protein ACR2QT_10890 [Woeseiaceae bacterium]